MTKKKLYAVTVQYQAYVLAESETEAEDFASEITRTEPYPWISAAEANGKELGWTGDCCVYHNGTGDIRLEGPPGAGWASGALSKLRAEVDTALAEPEPEGPTVMEIIELADEIEESGLGQVDLVRAALARWGTSSRSNFDD